jgi:hypothetical protein
MNTEQFDGHTPGPWDVIRDSRNDVVISHGGEETVCRLPHYPLFSNAQFKNAHLIAAAPDLLAEVKRLRLMVHELLKDADHDTHIWFHSNGWCEDLRQPCAVCGSGSDCGQSLITPQ